MAGMKLLSFGPIPLLNHSGMCHIIGNRNFFTVIINAIARLHLSTSIFSPPLFNNNEVYFQANSLIELINLVSLTDPTAIQESLWLGLSDSHRWLG